MYPLQIPPVVVVVVVCRVDTSHEGTGLIVFFLVEQESRKKQFDSYSMASMVITQAMATGYQSPNAAFSSFSPSHHCVFTCFVSLNRRGVRKHQENPNFHQLAPKIAYGEDALGAKTVCPRDGRPGCALVDGGCGQRVGC